MVVRATEISEEFSGPLPHPAVLSEYNRVVPDGAERIMQMAERQVAHRQDMERIYVSSQALTEGRGQLMAFVLAGLALVLGAALVFTNHFGHGFSLARSSSPRLPASTSSRAFSSIARLVNAVEKRSDRHPPSS